MSEHIPSCAAAVPVFRMLPDSELMKLGEAMDHRYFRKGEVIATAGTPLDHLIVVAEGRLNVVHTTIAGREQVVRSLEPGEFLGELALFHETKLDGDIIAALNSAACVLPRKAVQAVLLQHPTAALKLVEEMAKRLASAEQLIADLGLRDVGQRLAAELVRLMEAEQTPGGTPASAPLPGFGQTAKRALGDAPLDALMDMRADSPVDAPVDEPISSPESVLESSSARSHPRPVPATVPVPWSHLAAKLGTTPETLSRRLGSLADQGTIRQLGGRKLLILDPDKLKRIAEG